VVREGGWGDDGSEDESLSQRAFIFHRDTVLWVAIQVSQ
jgi:hypothetical protein